MKATVTLTEIELEAVFASLFSGFVEENFDREAPDYPKKVAAARRARTKIEAALQQIDAARVGYKAVGTELDAEYAVLASRAIPRLRNILPDE